MPSFRTLIKSGTRTLPMKRPTGSTEITKEDNQVASSNITNYQVLHTVTSGKTFYMTSLTFSGRTTSSGAAGDRIRAVIRNDSDVVQTMWNFELEGASAAKWVHVTFPIPIEIAADWDVAGAREDDQCGFSLSITGWEE